MRGAPCGLHLDPWTLFPGRWVAKGVVWRGTLGEGRGTEGVLRYAQLHGGQACGHHSQEDPGENVFTESWGRRHHPNLCTRQGHPVSAPACPLAGPPIREEMTTDLRGRQALSSPHRTVHMCLWVGGFPKNVGERPGAPNTQR